MACILSDKIMLKSTKSTKSTKEERILNRKAKSMLRNMQSVEDESTKPFVMEELEKAIHKMRTKGAAGEDEIPPSFLKALGPVAKEALLSIFNQSYDDASVPQMWRRAIIIPEGWKGSW